jgi:hypothetical protein
LSGRLPRPSSPLWSARSVSRSRRSKLPLRLRGSRTARRSRPPRSRSRSPVRPRLPPPLLPQGPAPRQRPLLLPPRQLLPLRLLRLQRPPLLPRPRQLLLPRPPPRQGQVCLGHLRVRRHPPPRHLLRGCRLPRRRPRRRRWRTLRQPACPVRKHRPRQPPQLVRVALTFPVRPPARAPRAPETTRSPRARACREAAAKAASRAKAARRRRLPARATTRSLPARECHVRRVADRLLPVPVVPAPGRHVPTPA